MLAERIQTPNERAASDLGVLAVDELLYDGSALHTAFTLSNPTGETLLYTVDGLYLDGCPLTRSTLFAEGAGTAGYLLGGTLDGLPLPMSVSAYNEAEALYAFDGQGRYLGTAPVPEEKHPENRHRRMAPHTIRPGWSITAITRA